MSRLLKYIEHYPIVRDRLMPLIASSTRRRLANGAFWNGIGNIISKSAVLLTSFLLARILGKEGFGEYGVVNSTTIMLAAVAGFGVGTTATKYVAQLRSTDKVKAGRIISLSSMITWISGILYGLFFVVFASWLAEKTLAAPHLAVILQISSISVGLGVINGTQVSVLAGFEAYKSTAIVNVVCYVVQSILVVSGAYVYGLKGAISGMAISTIFLVVSSRYMLVREMRKFGIRNWWREAWAEWRVLVGFSLPAFLSTMIAGPVYWGCNVLLANQPEGYAELGVFNAANQWYMACMFVPGLLMTAALPLLSEKYGNQRGEENIRITKRMMSLTLFLVIPLALIVGILAPFIMKGYGAGFVSGYPVLIMCVLTAGVHAIITPAWIAIVAAGRMWICFFMNFGCSLLMVIGVYFLIQYGAFGFSVSRLVAFIVHGCWLYWYFETRLKAQI